jgi:uncharacterized phage-associated protein
MPATVDSAFAIAFWFADKALSRDDYLRPQKLQTLMFLAQAYYAVRHPQGKLMPAVFVADELGPIEPNVYVAFSNGRPRIDMDFQLSDTAEAVVADVWRRFGHLSSDHLTRLSKRTPAYKQAFQRGVREEISLEAMRQSFSRASSGFVGFQPWSPRILRTQTGRSVKVRAWVPGEPEQFIGSEPPPVLQAGS